MFRKGFDGLVKFIGDKIAECGDSGGRKQDIKPWIEEWYRLSAEKGVSALLGRPPPPATVDDALVNHIWPMVLRDKSLSFKNPRSKDGVLVADEDRIWIAMTGHRVDHKKLPNMFFQLLSLIAQAGRAGIHQPDLVRSSGQDKRSVPQRTDALDQQGYIYKKKVTWNASATSWLVLRKFVPEDEEVDAYYHSVTKAAPGTRDTKSATQLAQIVMKCLKPSPENPKPMVVMENLRQEAGVVKHRNGRDMLRRTLSFMSDLDWVEIWTGENDLSGQEPDILAVKLIAQPHPNSWRQFEDAYRQYYADSKKGPRKDPDQVLENFPAGTGTWDPHIPLSRQIFEHIDGVPYPGLDSQQLGRRLGFSFYKKPQEQIMGRLTSRFHTVQPPDQRAFTIVRDNIMKYKSQAFVYRTARAHQDAVDAGKTTWEALNYKGTFDTAPEMKSDQWGFTPVHHSRLHDKDYATSLSESFKAFALSIRHNKKLDENLDNTRVEVSMRHFHGFDEPSLPVQNPRFRKTPRTTAERLRELKRIMPKQKQWTLFAAQAKAYALRTWQRTNGPSAAQRVANAASKKRPAAKELPNSAKKAKTSHLLDVAASHSSDVANGHPSDVAMRSSQADVTMEDSQQADNESPVEAARRKKETLAQLEIDHLLIHHPGAYVNAPLRIPQTRGRPKKRIVFLVKSDRLKTLPWFTPGQSVHFDEGMPEIPNEFLPERSAATLPTLPKSSKGPRRSLANMQALSENPEQMSSGNNEDPMPLPSSSADAEEEHPTEPVQPVQQPGQPVQPPTTLGRRVRKSRIVEPVRKAGGTGTLAIQRKTVMTMILKHNGGLYPGGRESTARFAIEWQKSYGEKGVMPDPHTIEGIIKSMIDSGLLLRQYFTFHDKHGVPRTKAIIYLPDLTDAEAKIRYTQERMAFMHPRSFLPEVHGSIYLQEPSPDGNEGSERKATLIADQVEAFHKHGKKKDASAQQPHPSRILALASDPRASAQFFEAQSYYRLLKMEEHIEQDWENFVAEHEDFASVIQLSRYSHEPLLCRQLGDVYSIPGRMGSMARERELQRRGKAKHKALQADSWVLSSDEKAGLVATLTSPAQPFHGPSGTYGTLYAFEYDFSKLADGGKRWPDITDPSVLWNSLQNDEYVWPANMRPPHPTDVLAFVEWWEASHYHYPSPSHTRYKTPFINLSLSAQDAPDQIYQTGGFEDIFRRRAKTSLTKTFNKSTPKTRTTRKTEFEATEVRYVRDKAALRMIVAIQLVALLTKKTLRDLDWTRVASLLKIATPEAAMMKAQYLFQSKTNLVEVLQTWMFRTFRKAYSSGRLPQIDHNAYDEYRWDVALEWFCKQAEHWLRPAQKHRLFRQRKYLDTLKTSELAKAMPPDQPLKKTYVSLVARREAMANKPASWPLLEKTKPGRVKLDRLREDDIKELDARKKIQISKTFVRANNMTPGETYSPAIAERVLMQFGAQSLDDTLKEMIKASLIHRNDKIKAVKGRLFRQNHTWEKPYVDANFKNGFRAMYADALRYKEGMDEVLAPRASTSKKRKAAEAFGDRDVFYFMRAGEAMQLIESALHGEVKVKPDMPPSSWELGAAFDPPDNGADNAAFRDDRQQSRFGFSKQMYKTMHIDQANLIFPLKEVPYAAFRPGNLPGEEHRTETAPPPHFLRGQGVGCIPLWIDLNGQLMTRVWALAVGAVVHLLSLRAGVTAEGIVALMGPKGLSLAEVDAILEWLAGEGAAQHTRCGWYACGRWVGVVGTSIAGSNDSEDHTQHNKKRRKRKSWWPYAVPTDERGRRIQEIE